MGGRVGVGGEGGGDGGGWGGRVGGGWGGRWGGGGEGCTQTFSNENVNRYTKHSVEFNQNSSAMTDVKVMGSYMFINAYQYTNSCPTKLLHQAKPIMCACMIHVGIYSSWWCERSLVKTTWSSERLPVNGGIRCMEN